MIPVLVSQRLVAEPGRGEVRDALDCRWGDFLAAAGLLGIPVPSGGDLEAFLAAVPWQGLILSGGNDLACVSGDALSRRRDDLEGRLVDAALRRGIPVMGVCRGMQFLAWRDGFRILPVAGHAGTRHLLSPVPDGSALGRHAGLEVNSYHGFGVSGIRCTRSRSTRSSASTSRTCSRRSAARASSS